MNKNTTFRLVALWLGAVLSVGPTWAQQGGIPPPSEGLWMNVPFRFHAGAKNLPAGEYQINFYSAENTAADEILRQNDTKSRNGLGCFLCDRRTASPQSYVQVRGLTKRMSAIAMVYTQVVLTTAAGGADARVVFDKAGEKYILSEVWITGHDGFLLVNNHREHEHVSVNVQFPYPVRMKPLTPW